MLAGKEGKTMKTKNISEIANFIWSVADLLRGDWRQSEYGKIILPFTVIRRLECVLAPTKEAVLAEYEKHKDEFEEAALSHILQSASGNSFYNTSPYDFATLLQDSDNLKQNMKKYLQGFSRNVHSIIDKFEFENQIEKLDSANLLYLVIQKFSTLDLDPAHITNHDMGYVFEELIRKFSELSNETAGEHFTPREVIQLMVDVIFLTDGDRLTEKAPIIKVYDPACGTGGMLSIAEEYITDLNKAARVIPFGQELNPESYAICNSDMLIKGQDTSKIIHDNTLNKDGLYGEKFDYMLCNPPFGVEWKKVEKDVKDEHNFQGHAGRFGAGLPRINDGSLLFLQHMLSKMKPKSDKGSRLAIVFNGSPLFTGGAGSGESNIRKWIIENDWLEGIIALPNDMFYNTGIATYIWVLTNRKSPEREGKIQLVNATGLYEKMRKSLGSKRNYISQTQIAEITRVFGDFAEGDISKVFDNDDFGYQRITVERPLRLDFSADSERIEQLKRCKDFTKLAESKKKGEAGAKEIAIGESLQRQILDFAHALPNTRWMSQQAFEAEMKPLMKSAKLPLSALKVLIAGLGQKNPEAEAVTDAKGNPIADSDLRDNENVPLKEEIADYFAREVLPHAPDAWIDEAKTVIGYEIPFNRHFYQYQPPRPLEEIDAELKTLTGEILALLKEVA